MPEMVTSLVILRKLCETLCREGYFGRISTIRRGCWWLAVGPQNVVRVSND